MPLSSRSHDAFLFDDLLTSKLCLFKTYDSSSKSSISSCSRSSKSSDETVRRYAKSGLNRRTTLLKSDLDEKSPTTDLRHSRSKSSPPCSSSSVPSSPFNVSSLETSGENDCELCNSFTQERQYHLWKSRYTKSSLCAHCADDTLGKSYISYWGSPTYQKGSWKKRFKAERSTDIDLTPLLDVLKRIDQIDTSMGIPYEAYTKHLSKHTEDSDALSNCHIDEKGRRSDNLIQDNQNLCSAEVSSRPETGTENDSEVPSVYPEYQRLPEADLKINKFIKDVNETKVLEKRVKNIDDKKDADKYFGGENYFVSTDSDSEFENIFNDALNYNRKGVTLKKKRADSSYINDWLNKNKTHYRNTPQSLGNSSTRYLNTPGMQSTESNFPNETRLSENKISRDRQTITRRLNDSRGRKNGELSAMAKDRKVGKKVDEFSSDEDNIKSVGGSDETRKTERRRRSSKFKRNFEIERRRHSQNQFNERIKRERLKCSVKLPENVDKTVYDNEAIDIQADKNIAKGYPQQMDKVPDSYEDFNNSIERGTLDGRIKRSSTGSVPSSSVIKISQDVNEELSSKPIDLRRNSVSHSTAFWEHKLVSGSGNASECSDQESENNENQLNVSRADNLKNHLVINIQENAASTETGTDEDENFRKIQNKLENLAKHSMRYNMRRKSILKNKNITSSFLNEFLTVPAARTRNSESESGDSVSSGMKPEQLAKRRVSFQSTALPSSSSSSSNDEDIHSSEESDLCNIQDKDSSTKSNAINSTAYEFNSTKQSFNRKPNIRITEIDTGKTEEIDLDNNSFIGQSRNDNEKAEENAENEHIEWSVKDDKPGKDVTCNSHAQNMFYSAVKETSNQRRLCEPETRSREKTVSNGETMTNENQLKTTKIPYKHPFMACTDVTSKKIIRKSKTSDTDFLNNANDHDVAGRDTEKLEQQREFVSGSHKQVYESISGKNPAIKQESSTLGTKSNSIRKYAIENCVENSTINHIDHDQNQEPLREAFDNNDTGIPVRKRRPRAKLFSIAGEESPDEYSKLLDNPVELDSSDSSDVELSWRTRGYSGDFYMTRKSTTGSEIINKFRKVVMRKKSKEGNTTVRGKPLESPTSVRIHQAMETCF